MVRYLAMAADTTAKTAITLTGKEWVCSHPVAMADHEVSRFALLVVWPVAAGSQ